MEGLGPLKPPEGPLHWLSTSGAVLGQERRSRKVSLVQSNSRGLV